MKLVIIRYIKIGGMNMRNWPWLKIIWYVILIVLAIKTSSDQAEKAS